LNAIQALSQLSYTPGISAAKIARQEPRRISTGSIEVKKFALAKWPTAGILQRLFNLNFRLLQSAFGVALHRLSKEHLIRSHCWPDKGCIRIGFSQQYHRGVHQ
jgi:hypothetical protein